MTNTRHARTLLAALSSVAALASLAGCRGEDGSRAERELAERARGVAASPSVPVAAPADSTVFAPAASVITPSPEGAAPADAAMPLRVRRLVVASGVRNREPEGARDAFRAAEVERVYAFVEVANPGARPGKIVVTFEPEKGPSVGHVELDVGATKRWRTWAYTLGARKAGAWTAVVRDEEGAVLARAPFRIEA